MYPFSKIRNTYLDSFCATKVESAPYLFVIGGLDFFAKLQNDLAEENGKNNEIGSTT